MSGDVAAWMKFYPSDWMAGTRRMPASAKGIYMDLLCESWRYGGLPDDPEELARICAMGLGEFAPLWDRYVRAKWYVDEATGELRNDKLEEVREEQERRRESGRERQRRFREKRNARGNAPGNTSRNAPGNTPGNANSPEGLRTQDSGVNQKGANAADAAGAAPPRKRKNGVEELARGVDRWEDVHGAMRSDLIEAMEAYRTRRAKRRYPVWDADQWFATLEAGEGNQECLIEAFKLADRSGWQSVHPKPHKGPRPLPKEDPLQEFRRMAGERGVL